MSSPCRLRQGEGYGACDGEIACQDRNQTTWRPNRACLPESERETGKGKVGGLYVHLAKKSGICGGGQIVHHHCNKQSG